jgi:hypothetical protein
MAWVSEHSVAREIGGRQAGPQGRRRLSGQWLATRPLDADEIVQHDGCLIYVLQMDHREPAQSRVQAWPKSDLLFLKLSLRNGMPIAEVAGFLARSEDEVREKSEELRRSA